LKSYQLVPVSTDGLVDILIINPFQASGLRTLSRIRARGQSTPLITAVPVGMKSPARHVIHIERLTLQLLPVLNQLVQSDFGAPAPQVFRMTDSSGRQVDRQALGRRLEQAVPTVQRSAESGTSIMLPSTLSAESIAPATLSADGPVPEDTGFSGSTVVTTTLIPDTGFGPTVRAVPVPPVSILSAAAPLAADGGPSPEEPARHPAASPDEDVTDTVLIVDDSPTVRRQMEQALQRMGLACVAVAGGKEALQALQSHDFAMALVDVMMGDMDGYQLTREIRRRAPDVPVIILTSRSSPFDLARGALSGCSSYLVKPVPLRRLRSVVHKRLQKRRDARQRVSALSLGENTTDRQVTPPGAGS
jgi:CheY-like chemotaxis protein